MNFFLGYLIARNLAYGPHRPASPGTGLFLYGGAFAVGFGLLCLSSSWGGWLALAGLCFVLLGAALQGHEREYDTYRPTLGWHGRLNGSTVGGAVFASVAMLALFVGLLMLHVKGGI